MHTTQELFQLFSSYQSDYWEVFYSRVNDGYFIIEQDGDTYEMIEDFEELADKLFYEILNDVLFSKDFKRPRDNGGLSREEIAAFYDKIAVYIEKMPELKEIADITIFRAMLPPNPHY